jgi:hypothetical protein
VSTGSTTSAGCQDLQNKIKALISARKAAGVNSCCSIDMQNNAKQAGHLPARITGTHSDLYVRVGGDDTSGNPGWKVWVKLSGNPLNTNQQAVKERPSNILASFV